MNPKSFHIGAKAIIARDGKILLLQKASGRRVFWDAPGGRVEDGETIEQALVREVHEELPSAVEVNIERQLSTWLLDRNVTDTTGLCLVFHEVTVRFDGDVQISSEHQDYAWVPFGQVSDCASEGVAQAVALLQSR